MNTNRELFRVSIRVASHRNEAVESQVAQHTLTLSRTTYGKNSDTKEIHEKEPAEEKKENVSKVVGPGY